MKKSKPKKKTLVTTPSRYQLESPRIGAAGFKARCLELMGRVGEARAVYEQVGAEPALGRCAAR